MRGGRHVSAGPGLLRGRGEAAAPLPWVAGAGGGGAFSQRLSSLQLSMKELLTSLLDNRTWSVLSQNASLDRPPQVDPSNLWQEWWDPGITVFGTLSVFLVMKVCVGPGLLLGRLLGLAGGAPAVPALELPPRAGPLSASWTRVQRFSPGLSVNPLLCCPVAPDELLTLILSAFAVLDADFGHHHAHACWVLHAHLCLW